MKVIKVKLVIFLGISLSFTLVDGRSIFEKVLVGSCSEVLDGDTIIVKGERIRLKGIDAPEKNQYSIDKVPIGRLSAEFLREKIKGKTVKVVYKKRGVYGRIIGSIWLGKENINKKMLEAGMAIPYGEEISNEQNAAYYLAKLKRVGIFRTVGFRRPRVFRKGKD